MPKQLNKQNSTYVSYLYTTYTDVKAKVLNKRIIIVLSLKLQRSFLIMLLTKTTPSQTRPNLEESV